MFANLDQRSMFIEFFRQTSSNLRAVRKDASCLHMVPWERTTPWYNWPMISTSFSGSLTGNTAIFIRTITRLLDARTTWPHKRNETGIDLPEYVSSKICAEWWHFDRVGESRVEWKGCWTKATFDHREFFSICATFWRDARSLLPANWLGSPGSVAIQSRHTS